MYDSLFSDKGLSLDRLRVLVEVHFAGGIAAAAPESPVKQSQYSTQLRELSEFFGTELTQREGKRLKLTETGVRLARLASEQLQALTDLRAECRGRIEYHIGTGDGLLHWLVIPRLTGFTERPARIVFSTHNLRTGDIIRRVQESRLDFGIVRTDAIPSGIKSLSIGKMEFTAIVPPTLLKGKTSTSIKEFLGLPLALMTTDGQFTARLKSIAANHQFELNTSLACESFPQALAAARTGRYATVLPKIALVASEIDFIELRHDAFRLLARELSLIWNARMLQVRPLAQQVSDHLRDAFSGRNKIR